MRHMVRRRRFWTEKRQLDAFWPAAVGLVVGFWTTLGVLLHLYA